MGRRAVPGRPASRDAAVTGPSPEEFLEQADRWLAERYPAIGRSLARTEHQRALQDTLRGFLDDQLPPAALRGMLDTDPGYSPQLHARLAREMGLAGLTIPEKFGGLGLSQAEACVVHTELGRALYPGPFLAGGLAATALLAAAGPEAAGPEAAGQKAAEHWLPLLAEGSVTGTIAAADKDGRWSSGHGGVRAHLTSHGWRLYGRCWYVIAAHVAGIIAVPAVAGSVPVMSLVEAGAPGLAVSGQPGLDLTRRVCVTSFDATPAVLLGEGDAAGAALARAEREFLLATAAEAVGGIGWCLDTAVVYASDRVRLGRPADSFQASRASASTCSRPSSPPRPPPGTPRSRTPTARPRRRPRLGWPRCWPAGPTAP